MGKTCVIIDYYEMGKIIHHFLFNNKESRDFYFYSKFDKNEVMESFINNHPPKSLSGVIRATITEIHSKKMLVLSMLGKLFAKVYSLEKKYSFEIINFVNDWFMNIIGISVMFLLANILLYVMNLTTWIRLSLFMRE